MNAKDWDDYDKRVQKLEAEGMTRSDAQGTVDATDLLVARAFVPPQPEKKIESAEDGYIVRFIIDGEVTRSYECATLAEAERIS